MTEYVDGNQLTLLESGREYFPALEAACDAAQREIHLETYIYEDDDAGQRIANALARAARRGVARICWSTATAPRSSPPRSSRD